MQWANKPRGNEAERLAKKLGWDGVGGDEKLVEHLRSVNFADLIKAQDVMTIEEKREWNNFAWLPCIEPYTAEQSFFTVNPLETFKSAWSNKIPLVIGGVVDEGLLWYRELTADPLYYTNPNAFKSVIPPNWNLPAGRVEEFGQQLKRFYFGDEECTVENHRQYFDILGDVQFWHGMHMAVRARVEDEQAAPTYLYRFAFASDPKYNMIRQVLLPNDVEGN